MRIKHERAAANNAIIIPRPRGYRLHRYATYIAIEYICACRQLLIFLLPSSSFTLAFLPCYILVLLLFQLLPTPSELTRCHSLGYGKPPDIDVYTSICITCTAVRFLIEGSNIYFCLFKYSVRTFCFHLILSRKNIEFETGYIHFPSASFVIRTSELVNVTLGPGLYFTIVKCIHLNLLSMAA